MALSLILKGKIPLLKATILINAKQERQFFSRKLPISQKSVMPPCLKAMILLVNIVYLTIATF